MNDDQERRRSALIVDFDNIYLSLEQIDRAAAESFATDPPRWLGWLERGMPPSREAREAAADERVVLIRHCYLNPRSFYKYRPYFTRAAFTVIDCPPLTTHGKTSADIRMVMDVLDILADKPWIDEFIIFSGDADFTPVLFRLRAHDKRTTVLAIGPAAAAYVAASDRMIREDQLIEHALEISTEAPRRRREVPEPSLPGSVGDEVLDEIAARLYQEASSNGEIVATQLPRLYKEFRQFHPDSNWLGFGSLRALTLAIVNRHPALAVVDEGADSWRVEVPASAGAAAGEGRAAERAPASPEADLERRIVAHVKRLVDRAPEPLIMARAAHDVLNRYGSEVTESGWLGHGTFKELLVSAADPGFEVFTAPGTPGFIYDPARHEAPSAEARDPLAGLPEELAEFIRRVSRVTGTPLLRPDEYRMVFTAIADDLSRNPYSPYSTSKSVRDLCIESGRAVSRANVLWILRGISFTGHRLGEGEGGETAAELAAHFRDNVLNLAENANLELSDDERRLLDRWVTGGFGGHATPSVAPD